MARIRTVKPEFWTSAQVLECSTNARLLFIGLWNFCDDEGRHPWSAKQVKAEVFPSDDMDSETILGMLNELSTNDLVRRYTVDGKEYFYVTGWRHQRIDKKQDPKYPAPPDGGDDHSGNVPGTLPPDTIGKEGKGKESKGARKRETTTAYAFIGNVIRLNQSDFDRWREAYPHIPDFVAELTSADDYYRTHPPDKGEWFFPVSRWLAKANKDAIEGKKPPEDPMERMFAAAR